MAMINSNRSSFVFTAPSTVIYSRRVLWLEVSSSNNDPEIVGKYYADYVDAIKGTSRRIRADKGTENVNVEAMQRFFRRSSEDDFARDKSFKYGRSISN